MDIFEELGLHRYINAQDTFTTYGASCMPAASLRAMREIAASCVELAEVQAKTGDALAKLTHNEGAYISNGAAGGMMVATAAALARDDEKIFHTLPEITGPRYEVVMQAAQCNMYDRGRAPVRAEHAAHHPGLYWQPGPRGLLCQGAGPCQQRRGLLQHACRHERLLRPDGRDLRPPRAACPCGHGRLRSTGQYAGQRGRHC